jgi:hypothetical protein
MGETPSSEEGRGLVGLFRWSLAFVVGVTLFAMLPEYGSLVVLQAEDEDNFFLGVGGSAVIGATLVFVAGRPLALVLCFVCPLAGVAVYELSTSGLPRFDYLVLVLYTCVYFAFAMVGGGAVALVLAVVGRLQRRG